MFEYAQKPSSMTKALSTEISMAPIVGLVVLLRTLLPWALGRWEVVSQQTYQASAGQAARALESGLGLILGFTMGALLIIITYTILGLLTIIKV